jgi:hypothetical protein
VWTNGRLSAGTTARGCVARLRTVRCIGVNC